MNKLNLHKKVLEKRAYTKVIDASFSQLKPKFTPPEEIPTTSQVSDFFKMYNELFYDINETGETNSHEFLIKQSSAYINFQQQNEDIQSLLDEIAALRTTNLKLQQENLDLITSGSNG